MPRLARSQLYCKRICYTSNNNKGLDVQDQQDLCMQSVLPGTGPGGHGQVVLDGGGGEGYNCPYQ